MFGSNKVIGLDIGTSSIKIAELEFSGSNATLVRFDVAATPTGVINAGEMLDPSSVGAVISGLKGNIRTKRKNACIGLWGNSVIVKKISIPKIDRKLIPEQLKYEAEQYIPFDINTIFLDYFVIPRSSSPETLDLIIVAAQAEVIGQYISATRAGGFEPQIIDVSAFALANLYELNYGKPRGMCIGLLNIGAGVTNFVVMNDGYVVFARDIMVGGSNYTGEIQKELSVSFNEAEALKIGAVNKTGSPEQVLNVFSSVNETIADEVKNSLDFFSSSNIGLHVSKFYLTGGSSMVPGLAEAIGRSTGIPLEPLNPFNRVKIGNSSLTDSYLNQIAPIASVAMGLGMRMVGVR